MRHSEVAGRERDFWDARAPSLDAAIALFEQGPDRNTAAMLEAVAPLAGARVLDFACGSGVTTAWLADRGARVVGLDLSEASIATAQALAKHAGLDAQFVAGELDDHAFEPSSFDAVVGRYALHHVDLVSVAPRLARILTDGGRAAFVETMALNPLLSFAREHLSGRAGVASYGSQDERPLRVADLRVLERELGPVTLIVGECRFLRIFDRNVLRYRLPRVSRLLGSVDDALGRCGLGRLSYHQVVAINRRESGPA